MAASSILEHCISNVRPEMPIAPRGASCRGEPRIRPSLREHKVRPYLAMRTLLMPCSVVLHPACPRFSILSACLSDSQQKKSRSRGRGRRTRTMGQDADCHGWGHAPWSRAFAPPVRLKGGSILPSLAQSGSVWLTSRFGDPGHSGAVLHRFHTSARGRLAI